MTIAHLVGATPELKSRRDRETRLCLGDQGLPRSEWTTGIPGAPFLVHFVGLLFTMHGVFMLAAVYGLWMLQRCGLRLTFWLYVIAIPLGLLAMFPILPGSEWTTGNTVFQLVWIGIYGAIIWYLESDDVAILYGDY